MLCFYSINMFMQRYNKFALIAWFLYKKRGVNDGFLSLLTKNVTCCIKTHG